MHISESVNVGFVGSGRGLSVIISNFSALKAPTARESSSFQETGCLRKAVSNAWFFVLSEGLTHLPTHTPERQDTLRPRA